MLDKLIQELVVRQQRKVIIVSTFTKMLDCVEDFLSFRGGDGELFRYSRLDGGTSRARRNLGIRLFNDTSSGEIGNGPVQYGADQTVDYKVMLISTRAGGLGINLASASEIVMMDQYSVLARPRKGRC